MNFQSKNIVIIGGSSGIGRGIASSFIDKGANVCITGTKEKLEDYDEDLGKKDKWYIFNKIDLLDKKELEILKKSVNNKIKKNVFFVSAKEKSGLDKMCENIIEYLRDL